jgi:hypothetical protein
MENGFRMISNHSRIQVIYPLRKVVDVQNHAVLFRWDVYQPAGQENGGGGE